MTLVEIFAKNPLENIISSLVLKPDRVVFLSHEIKKIAREADAIGEILEKRGIGASVYKKSVAKNDIASIIAVLREVTNGGDDYVIDFSGGEESILVSLGMIFAAGQKNISLFKINPVSMRGVFYFPPHNPGEDFRKRVVDFSVGHDMYMTTDENIRLHGGYVSYTSFRFTENDEFYRDIDVIWDICRRDPVGWNNKINVFSTESSFYGDDLFAISENSFGNGRRQVDRKMFDEFLGRGLILPDRRKYSGGMLVYSYKNRAVKDCLTKSGSALEYYIYKIALSMKEKGRRIFDSATVGTVISWGTENSKTKNEIDVMLMRGFLPVFISCKNGDVKTDELYKLKSVSKKFGRDYAKAALAATSFFDRDDRAYGGDAVAMNIKSRAEDMEIRVIKNIHKMKEEAIAGAIAKLIK